MRVRGVVPDVDLQGAGLPQPRGRERVQVLGGVHPPPHRLLRPGQTQFTLVNAGGLKLAVYGFRMFEVRGFHVKFKNRMY